MSPFDLNHWAAGGIPFAITAGVSRRAKLFGASGDRPVELGAAAMARALGEVQREVEAEASRSLLHTGARGASTAAGRAQAGNPGVADAASKNAESGTHWYRNRNRNQVGEAIHFWAPSTLHAVGAQYLAPSSGTRAAGPE